MGLIFEPMKTNHPLYSTWRAMQHRCSDRARGNNFKHYAGKGIRVCARWQDFWLFVADVGERPTPLHTIDRIDGSKGYEPSNVRWATKSEQIRNQDRNKRTHGAFGRSQILADWAREFSLPHGALSGRLRLGWALEDALTKPVRPKAGGLRVYSARQAA